MPEKNGADIKTCHNGPMKMKEDGRKERAILDKPKGTMLLLRPNVRKNGWLKMQTFL